MIIICDNCEHPYDIDDHDYCPNCGDDNEQNIKDMGDE